MKYPVIESHWIIQKSKLKYLLEKEFRIGYKKIKLELLQANSTEEKKNVSSEGEQSLLLRANLALRKCP